MAIRLYELAKQINVPNKVVIDLLKKSTFEVKNHMSVVSDEAIDFVKKALLLNKESKKINPEEPKKDIMQTHTNIKKKITTKNDTFDQKKNFSSRNKSNSSFQKPIDHNQSRPYFKKNNVELKTPVIIDSVIIEPMNPAVAAVKMGKNANDIIMTLLSWGLIIPKNQVMKEDVVARLADYFGIKKVTKNDERQVLAKKDTHIVLDQLEERLPVIVIVGHVDHGKTSLLDYIRKTRVAAKEKGGITQHIGAYEASTAHGNLIFLDTPGHEAFSKIRQRGVRLADIAILIIAADDGVMPQTIEAIKHIKAMNVPVVAVINKVDRVDASRIDIIKQQLAQHDLLPEDWGGEVICVPVSAKTGQGVDTLLEMLVLQSKMLELRTNSKGLARGYILESELEKGRGAVATLICQDGTIKVGDYFVCGKTVGHVSSLIDSYGKRIMTAGPSVPVRVAGFQDLADVGDYLEVVSKDVYLQKRTEVKQGATNHFQSSSHVGALNIILKIDTNSTQEALIESIEKVSKKSPVPFHVLQSSIGSITESDVELAYNTGSRIIGLHVKLETNAAILAQERGVVIELYDIIYKLLEALEAFSQSKKTIEYVREKTGTATVLKVFDIKKIGVIAGCYVKDGLFVRKGIVVALRNGSKIGEGRITSLQREKKTVKEVHAGFECGFMAQGFQEWQEGDIVECYIEVPKK